jgi:hypothetical protein
MRMRVSVGGLYYLSLCVVLRILFPRPKILTPDDDRIGVNMLC